MEACGAEVATRGSVLCRIRFRQHRTSAVNTPQLHVHGSMFFSVLLSDNLLPDFLPSDEPGIERMNLLQ